jgi:hypothetical protein
MNKFLTEEDAIIALGTNEQTSIPFARFTFQTELE